MYKLIGTNSVKRLADGACIPFADGNRDYEEYKQWIAEGNTPEPEFTEAELAEQTKQVRISELKQLLAGSDYKETQSYMDSHTDEENKANYDQRTAWRNEIRELEVLTK